MVHTDLEYRLRAGEAVGVEEYWQRYPELRADPAVALDLLATEFALRQCLRGGGPSGDKAGSTPRSASISPPPLPALGPSSEPSGEKTVPVVRGHLLHAGEPFGKFELLQVLGQGSSGTVFQAYDHELQRVVALQMRHPDCLATQAERERFLREARSAARLNHPGIVALHEAGEIDNTCYLVRTYVPGTTLQQRCLTSPLGITTSVRLVAEVADALHDAHRQGVVHRDVKPSNILLTADDRPLLTDFGLAKVLEGEARLTSTGDVLGTPAFMAPEQARGESHRVDARSDIYSLGVVLYELLTGELPFRGSSRLVLRQVLEEEPRPPRQRNDRIPVDLETVCLKAMSKEPASRYATAAEFAADLRRFLQGQPVQARPVGTAGKLWRWARRRPLASGLLAALLLVSLLGFAGIVWGWRQADYERRRAEAMLAEVAKEQAKARQDFRKVHQFLADRIGRELTGLSDRSKADLSLLDGARAYYEDFLQERSAEPFLLEETARAATMLAAINWRRRCIPRVISGYQHAAERWGELAAQRPQVPAYCLEQARCLLYLCQIALDFDTPEHSAAPGRQACTLADRLMSAQPSALEVLALAATAYYSLAHLEERQEDHEAALGHYRRAAALAGRLQDCHQPGTQGPLTLLAEAWIKIGKLEQARGQRPAALAAFLASQRIWNDLLALPSLRLSLCLDHRQDCFWDSALYDQSISPFAPVTIPADVVKKPLAKCCYWIASNLDRTDRAEEALCSFQQAADLFEQLAEKEPNIRTYRRDLAASYHNIGTIHQEQGRLAEAAAAYRRALALRRQLCREEADNAGYLSDWKGTQRRLSTALLLLGQVKEAREVISGTQPY